MGVGHVDSAEQRLEFSDKTKKALKAIAGGRCCHPQCLDETEGATQNARDELVARGVGVASHIYAAKKNGPRGQNGLSPQEIRSASNGMWMCASHGRQIDDFEQDYPALQLLRMKAVRELAHKIQQQDRGVSEFVKRIGILAWNDCVWDHMSPFPLEGFSSVNVKAMTDAFTSIAIQRLAAIDNVIRNITPVLPAHIKQGVIANAISAIGNISEDKESIVSPNLFSVNVRVENSTFLQERTWAIGISKKWASHYEHDISSSDGFICSSQFFLTVKDPRTAELVEAGIWQGTRVSSRIRYSEEDGETILIVAHSEWNRISQLRWTMRMQIQHGAAKISSELKLVGLNFPYMQMAEDRILFLDYYRIIKRIAEGWQVICHFSHLGVEDAFYSLETLDPRAFNLDSKISKENITILLSRCEKVKAGLEIERRWIEEIRYVCSDQPILTFDKTFFLNNLDVSMIHSAIEKLIIMRNSQSLGTQGWSTGPLVMINETVGIRLRCDRRGMLMFELFKPYPV